MNKFLEDIIMSKDCGLYSLCTCYSALDLAVKLRLHVAFKPVPKPLSVEPVRKPPRVNALSRLRNRLRKPLPRGGFNLVSAPIAERVNA